MKNFSIFRNKPSENPKAPTHIISLKIGEKYEKVGACWSKDMKDGQKYLSCMLQDVYVDHTDRSKSKTGFSIVDDKSIPKVEVEPDMPPESPELSEDAF